MCITQISATYSEYILSLGETIDQAFIGHFVYYYNVTNYSNPIGLLIDKPIWSVART